jgi:hypothetical protein
LGCAPPHGELLKLGINITIVTNDGLPESTRI